VNVSSRFAVTGFGVIVTGGASGLGLAYGEVLAAHGARLTLIDVDAAGVRRMPRACATRASTFQAWPLM
jgi:NAD(P)-dependent dehydrogenase (short-subunit alcohol dehydrogenase family)